MSTAFTQFSLNGVPVRTDLRGDWNASTNSPTLVSGAGQTGEMYRVSTAGSTTLDGTSSWAVDDYVYFNGTVWLKDDHNNAGGGGGGESLSATLAIGNTTGGTNIVVTTADEVQGTDGTGAAGSDLLLRGGDGGAGVFAGGDLVLTPGAGTGGAADGVVRAAGQMEVTGPLDVGGNVRERLAATGVATGVDLVSRVIANPNAGVNSQMVFFEAQIVAHAEPPGAPPGAVDTAAWKVEGVIVREVVTDTVLFPTAPVITPLYNPNAPGWDISVTADDPTKSLKITVTVDGFGGFPGPPPASFFCELTLIPTGTPV